MVMCMCVQGSLGASRGFQISWSWSYRCLLVLGTKLQAYARVEVTIEPSLLPLPSELFQVS